MSKKVFYVAAVEGQEPFQFWSSNKSVERESDVGDLQNALVEKYAQSLNAYAATIFKLNERRTLGATSARAEFTNRETLLQKATEVPPDNTIEEAFAPRQTLVILLRCVAPQVPVAHTANAEEIDEINDVVGQLQNDFTKYVTNVTKGDSPSAAAKSTAYNQIQRSNAALLDGRFAKDGPQTAAPPVEIYHSAFARFAELSRMQDLEVPDDVLCNTAELLRSVSTISVQEDDRDEKSRAILSQVLGLGLEHVSNQDKSSADFMAIQSTPMNVNAAPVICEVKGELGNGGSDPSVQASFSYARFYCSPERAQVRTKSCCPAFLIGLAGPWLVILGAVLTSRTIVQRLSPYEWLGCSRVLDNEQVHRVARRLYALRLSIEELKVYYSKLSSPTVIPGHIHPRFCPSINTFSLDDKKIPFVYAHPLERDPGSVTFKVIRTDTNVPIVIKFVRQYGEDVHLLLSEQGLAPKLLSYAPLGKDYDNLHLVAMEFVEGQTLYDAYNTSDPLPADVRNGVRKALDILGEKQFVFGDLRRPNVMLANGVDSIEKRLRFIDFDWAGKEGELRYPFHLAGVVRHPSGASENELIMRVHQENMFRSL